jgi:hypothetical protein
MIEKLGRYPRMFEHIASWGSVLLAKLEGTDLFLPRTIGQEKEDCRSNQNLDSQHGWTPMLQLALSSWFQQQWPHTAPRVP